MLTDQKVKALKPKEKQYKVSDEKGLYLLIKPNGGKYWRFRYRFFNKDKALAIGVYPDTTLKKARLIRDDAKKLLLDGVDPVQNKKDQKAKKQDSNFHDLALAWMDTKRDWSKSTKKDTLSRFNNHVFPFIGNQSIQDITRHAIINIIDRLKTKKIHSTTIAKIHRHIVNVYKYAIASGVCERNLALDLQPLLPQGDEIKHRKALTQEEIPLFLNKLESYGGSFEVIIALKLLILTASRPGEVQKAVWEDFDLENSVWIRPSERMKMKKEHPTPLPNQAVNILVDLHKVTGNRKYLFPNQRDPLSYMSENTLNQAIKKRMGFDATAHGMRSVFSTLANKFGYNPDAIEMHLAHIEKNAVRRAYNRTKYWDERVLMAQQWADYLDNLKAGNNVVIGNFKKTS